MTQQQLIEYVQQHHPHMREKEIRLELNRTQRQLCRKADILTDNFDITTVADQRWYTIDSDVVRILNVTLTDADGLYYRIPRLVGLPDLDDDA